jgi:hypothetical protein
MAGFGRAPRIKLTSSPPENKPISGDGLDLAGAGRCRIVVDVELGQDESTRLLLGDLLEQPARPVTRSRKSRR